MRKDYWLRGYTPAQQAAINQYGYLPVGWSGAPIVMPAPAPAPAPVAPKPQVTIRPTTGLSVPAQHALSPAVSAPAVINFTGGGSGGGFDVSSATVSEADLIAAQKAKAASSGGSGWLILLAAAAAAMGSS
jgi:hypothetical protein